ncbi:MAG: DUF488 domain-containing protein [Caldicoprobacterales bacterium]|jgi:uncharacterized protein YeaO (DUF488 family)|nr:DUF488 family protein [Clostridiales bacterium]
MAIQIKRIYDPVQKSDGIRLLVDRLWPRGISKEAVQLDGWPKELTPSTGIRVWFGHKEEKFDEFAVLYRSELDASPDAQKTVREIIQQSRDNTVTLLYAAKDPRINHAIILKNYLDEKMQPMQLFITNYNSD